MANRRLVRAITENINQGSSVSLVDQNNNGLRSKQFQEASCCSSKQKSCNVITERKTNVIKRLWRRLKGNKPQKKQTVNRETADEVVKSEKVEQKWYHKLSWCGNDKNTDTENKVKEDWELAVTGECDYSKGDAFQVNSSETLIIADNTFIVIGNKILKTPVEKVDAGVEENRLANENEYHRTGIGSIVDFASPKRGFPMVDVDSSGSFKPVSEPRAAKRVTTFCKLQPVPTTTQKQDSRVRPSVDSGIGGSNPSNGLSAEKNRPSPLLIDTTPKRYSKEEINVTLKNSKNVASAIFKQVSRLSLNGASTSVDKDDSYDNGALSVEDEVDEEIERAMNQVRVQPKGKGEFQIEREKRMFNPFMLRQTPNLSEGASGMCWSLSHRMPGEGGFRSATPKPKLPVARKKSMREVLLRHEHAKSVKAKKDQRKLEKITRRNQRVLDVRQSLEDKLQAMASGQEAKTEQTRRRRQDLHTARVGKTDRRLELARQRRKEIAATEKQNKENGVATQTTNVTCVSTRAAGFRSSQNAEIGTKTKNLANSTEANHGENNVENVGQTCNMVSNHVHSTDGESDDSAAVQTPQNNCGYIITNSEMASEKQNSHQTSNINQFTNEANTNIDQIHNNTAIDGQLRTSPGGSDRTSPTLERNIQPRQTPLSDNPSPSNVVSFRKTNYKSSRELSKCNIPGLSHVMSPRPANTRYNVKENANQSFLKQSGQSDGISGASKNAMVKRDGGQSQGEARSSPDNLELATTNSEINSVQLNDNLKADGDMESLESGKTINDTRISHPENTDQPYFVRRHQGAAFTREVGGNQKSLTE